MSQSTSLVCPNCRAAVNPADTRCSNCDAPISGVLSGKDSAPSTAENAATFSWDAVARFLRELTIGEYEILTELGRGGMAAVYLAHEHALNRKVALKVMSPSIMLTEGMVDRFYSEAVTQANLTHANIVGVHAVRRDQELHYFAMQYIPGRSLQQVLRAEQAANRELSIPVIQSLIHQVGSALAYAHRRGVIHRDIKPANVLLNADGDAVVTDFGIAKVASSPSQTMTGTVVGTAPYMSPEQCYAAELTGASDQYSLGILAYELVTGSPPFSGIPFVVMQAHTLEAPPPISARRPDCPPEFAAAIMKMLAKLPEDRYADVHAALSALETRPASSRTDDPVRATLIRMADVAGVEASLGDVLRVPLSPMPRTRRAGTWTPGSHPRLGTPPTGYRSLTPEPSRVVMLRLGDPPSKVESGEVVRLDVQAMDIHGAPLEGLALRWSSSNPKIARIKSDSGEIEALMPGSADIVVSCESAVATARLVVRDASVARVAVRLPESVEVGDKVSLHAEAFDARGVILDRPVRWTMASNPTASLSGDGVFTAKAPGQARFSATIDGTTTEFRLVVRGPSASTIELSEIPGVLGIGEAVGISVTARDKRGTVITDPNVVWTSSNPSVADIDRDGKLSGLSAGETTLEARCDEARAITNVAVGIVPIATLEVTGLPETVTQGAKKRIEVVAKDTAGHIRKIPATWTSSAPGVASVDTSSQLVTMSPGNAILRVRCGSSERAFPLEVRENVAISQRALKALSSVPRPAAARFAKGTLAVLSLGAVGALIAFVVTGQDGGAGEKADTGSTVVFQGGTGSTGGDSGSAGGGSEKTGGEGEKTGGGTGISGPIATGDTTLRLAIANIAGTLRVNEAATPELRASRGGTRLSSLPTGVRWASSDPSVVAVDAQSGRVTAMREGNATLRVRVGGQTDSIFLRVERVVASRVTIASDPGLASLQVDDTVRARATARDANGNELPSRAVDWSISPAGFATVDAAGLVRATDDGTARLIARVDAVSDTMFLTIRARPRIEPQPKEPEPKAPEPKAPEPKAPETKAPEPKSPETPAIPPLGTEDVSNAAAAIVRAITTNDTARVTQLYLSETRDDARRVSELKRRMSARGRVTSQRNPAGTAEDVREHGERPTARISRTFQFETLARRPQPSTIEFELTFQRAAAGWRLLGFRILKDPVY